MRAALGLPVPQIKREKKRLEDSDLTVVTFIRNDAIDSFGKK